MKTSRVLRNGQSADSVKEGKYFTGRKEDVLILTKLSSNLQRSAAKMCFAGWCVTGKLLQYCLQCIDPVEEEAINH